MLVQIPYGIVADKYGRKPVLFLSLLGLVVNQTWCMVVCKLFLYLPASSYDALLHHIQNSMKLTCVFLFLSALSQHILYMGYHVRQYRLLDWWRWPDGRCHDLDHAC